MAATIEHIHRDAGVEMEFTSPIQVGNSLPRVPYLNDRMRSSVQPKTLDSLLNHFGEVIGRRRSAVYKETSVYADKTNYLKAVEKEIKLFEQCGFGKIKENMIVTGVSQQYERYADGSAEKIVVPPHNIYVSALHNVSLWVNPNPTLGEVVVAEIATNEETHREYQQKGWTLMPHKVKSLTEIFEVEQIEHVLLVEPSRVRMETWKYTTKADVVRIVEAGTDVFLPAIQWEVALHSKSNHGSGCIFDKNAFTLLLMHYCGLHCEEIKVLPEQVQWKSKARCAAVKAHGELVNVMTMHMWALHLAKESPQLPKYTLL